MLYGNRCPRSLAKFSLAISAVFSTAVCLADPFTGAFIEGALGGGIGKNGADTVTTQDTANGTPMGIAPAPQSVSKDKSKFAFASRAGVGYGYSLGNNFNLTGLLTYGTPQNYGDLKLKNNVSLLLQPGYYIPSARTLVYGTVGYATASFDYSAYSISVNDRVLLPGITGGGVTDSRNSPKLGSGNFRTSGPVIGLGAKYAATDRLYAGFDYTYTAYQGKKKEGDVLGWQDVAARTGNGGAANQLSLIPIGRPKPNQ